MYYYDSHLGGVYSSSSKLDWDALYCESCGDSDHYIGEAKTAEELFTLLENEDVYDFMSINEMVASEYGAPFEVCVLLKNHVNNMVYVNFEPPGCKFGEKHELIQYPCMKKKYASCIAKNSLKRIDVEDIDFSSLKEIKEIKRNNKTYILFECYSNTREFEEGASYGFDDGWWGWIDSEDEYVKKDIEDILREYKKEE